MTDEAGTPTPQVGRPEWGSVPAWTILGVRGVWILPQMIRTGMFVSVTAIDPVDHPHGLPVRGVDQDSGAAHGSLVIPSTYNASVPLGVGCPAPAGTTPPATPGVHLLENTRLGRLAVSLAAR